ncbi:MAG: DUF6078 family protein [Bacteroidaceae bacterium]|nr:DUF6078 family protein [Bacteroidaceae bacterium]
MKKVNYDEVPMAFGQCTSQSCPMRENCLRSLAWQAVPKDVRLVTIINPALTQEGENCPLYSSPVLVTYARGFLGMQQNMLTRHYTAFREFLCKKMGRNHYFDCRKGLVLITPDEQTLIRQALAKVGADPDLAFDAYEDGFLWK